MDMNIDYAFLTSEDQHNLLRERILELEAQHWRTLLILTELEDATESLEYKETDRRRDALESRTRSLRSWLDERVDADGAGK